ncbi:box C/D snoRNA protein 1 [Tribolium castaneum]|uniref:Box C/D snoRNA protein 1 n=1 Tax=Tribolium castaneum TaxID=7070 RepID=D6X4S3_TRICA|nr:PREDICTED: box C/D snoRNA protein 1 [Tribolium castaneum]EEZ97683.1 Box C/D snoRNA protein 1-like Protein [Tribolium castaneum]|eukprot:XP_969070.1 PREDICTED: box C/D snoRNA protein 1 [Tribolium castaneum]
MLPDGETPSCSETTASGTKLGTCEVCARKNAKYCCPRCEVKTCSLSCNKIHKLEVECSGVRDRAKFIPVNKFTNLDLSSDYRLLEEISRVVETSKKGRSSFGYNFTKGLLRLQQEALKRHITLKYLPRSFVRHKNNTTRFDFKSQVIEWRVDWVFVNCENLKISEDKVPENLRLSKILDKYLSKQGDEALQYYQAANLPGLRILLKAELKSGKKFYELDPSYTLRECLKNRVIIEYPTIHLVLKDQAIFYDIVDSDDEEDTKAELQKQIKSGQEVINKIIKKSESDDSLYESLRNLLFINEYSDEEQGSDEEAK